MQQVSINPRALNSATTCAACTRVHNEPGKPRAQSHSREKLKFRGASASHCVDAPGAVQTGTAPRSCPWTARRRKSPRGQASGVRGASAKTPGTRRRHVRRAVEGPRREKTENGWDGARGGAHTISSPMGILWIRTATFVTATCLRRPRHR